MNISGSGECQQKCRTSQCSRIFPPAISYVSLAACPSRYLHLQKMSKFPCAIGGAYEGCALRATLAADPLEAILSSAKGDKYRSRLGEGAEHYFPVIGDNLRVAVPVAS